MLIGPEGDFSENEIEQMKQAHVEFISLGPRRLRSETAAIVGISNLNQLIGDEG